MNFKRKKMNLDFSSQHCMNSTLLRLFKWLKNNLNLLSQRSTLVISVDLSGTIHGREMGTCRLVSAEPRAAAQPWIRHRASRVQAPLWMLHRVSLHQTLNFLVKFVGRLLPHQREEVVTREGYIRKPPSPYPSRFYV